MPLPPALSIDQIAATYERLLQEEGKQTAQQFVVDHLLAQPAPFLLWYFNAVRRRQWWMASPAEFVNQQAPASLGPGGFGIRRSRRPQWKGLDEDLRSPDWLLRMRHLRNHLDGAWQEEVVYSCRRLPHRWLGWWSSSFEEMLTIHYVAQSGAPVEDYSTGFFEGDLSDNAPLEASWWVEYSPLAAEFIFRGGAYDLHERIPGSDDRPPVPESQIDLSAAVAHGVWYQREYTWCDTPVGGTDSPSCFSRTARGFLRLPNLCPECERFYREQIARPGGLRAFALLQHLDVPEPLRPEDLSLLDDPDIMLGDKPLLLLSQEMIGEEWQ